MKTTTRRQLKGYGLTPHLATSITQAINPIEKQGRTLIYNLNDVIGQIRQYLTKTRIKPQTRKTLETLLETLLQRIGNLVPIPFVQTTDPETSRLAKKAFNLLQDTLAHFAEMKADIATIRGR